MYTGLLTIYLTILSVVDESSIKPTLKVNFDKRTKPEGLQVQAHK